MGELAAQGKVWRCKRSDGEKYARSVACVKRCLLDKVVGAHVPVTRTGAQHMRPIHERTGAGQTRLPFAETSFEVYCLP